MPEQRIERRLTGETIPVDAVYMTTITEDHPAAEEADAPELKRYWHYFRVPVEDAPRAAGFGGSP